MTASGLPQSQDTGGTPAGGEVNTIVDIYSKHERRIYRYCLALLRNPDDAEDATQETFTRAAPFLPNLAGDLSAYLTTVARNICCDVVRARAKRPVPLDDVSLADRSVSPERQSIDWDVVRRMWRQLTPSERLLFAYTFAGYRYEEIASRTGMSRPSVSVGLTRARRRLRDLATAIGALGALPLGLRRLLDRTTRRVNNAVAAGQQLVVSLVDQAGTIAAGLLAGLVTAGAISGGAVAAPATLATGHRQAAALAGGPPAAPVAQLAVGGSVGVREPAARPNPAAPSTPPTVLGTALTTLPGGNETPVGVAPQSVTTSPNFASDGTAFMVGQDFKQCAPSELCAPLFQTRDAGATWTPVWPGSFRGGVILLSPRFPADPTIFAVGPSGLQSGTPADAAPSPLLPGVFGAAIAPDSTAGHAKFAGLTQGGTTLLTYTVGASGAQPGPALPPGFIGTGLVFTGPGQVAVAGYAMSAAAPAAPTEVAMVVRCTLSAAVCDTPASFPGEVAVTLAPAPGGTVVASSLVRAWASTDGGSTFRLLATAAGGENIVSAAVGPNPAGGSRLLISWCDTATRAHASLSYTDDLGATFTDATGNLHGLGGTVLAEVLGGGTLLVGVMPKQTDIALDESSGNGVWSAARPA